jgi:hypothetical protein
MWPKSTHKFTVNALVSWRITLLLQTSAQHRWNPNYLKRASEAAHSGECGSPGNAHTLMLQQQMCDLYSPRVIWSNSVLERRIAHANAVMAR